MTERTTAVLIERLGKPEVLVQREIPLGDPGTGEVHLEIEAAGVNFADLAMRMGLYTTVPPRPFSPGFEVAGRIARVGPGVEDWKVGDRAVALIRYGGYARDVIIPATQLFPYPASFEPTEAAAVPVVFLTAWVCLFEAGNAREGETVLVLGAGGGVGTAAVQLAVRHGLRVIGTAGTPEKRAFVTDELRADACFDSRGDWAPDVERHVGPRGLDLALDPVGGKGTKAIRDMLAPLGRLVLYGLSAAMPSRKRSWPRAIMAYLRTPRIHPVTLIEPNIGIFGVHLLHLGPKEFRVLPPALEEIYGGLETGELRPIVDSVFPLTRDGAVEAHRRLHARQNLGKVVLSAAL